MRVSIRLISGPSVGQRVNLVSNQKVVVGRSERAEFMISNANNLGDEHFCIETDDRSCRIRDLSSSGTSLNDQFVKSATLTDGDRIKAGDCLFEVSILGAPPPSDVPPVVIPATAPTPTRAPSTSQHIQYTMKECDSGVTRYEFATTSPGDVFASVMTAFAVFAMVDFRRIEKEMPDLETPDHLFDWLGAGNVASPVFISQEQLDVPAMSDEVWGRNGVVVFFSKEEQEPLLQHLRSKARAEQDKVLGICWPSTLSLMLENLDTEFVKSFMGPFAMVGIENGPEANALVIYTLEPQDQLFDSLGFSQKEE